MKWRRIACTGLLACRANVVAEGACDIVTEARIVAGDSMVELFASGSEVKIQTGWYACHEVKRDEVVILQPPGRSRPIMKMIRVLPGDRFRLEAFQDGYRLWVNDRVLKTPGGSAYFFGGKGYRMLALYEESFRGVMPAETYFVFGTVAGGSLDSTRFGPVTKAQILGRVK